MEASRRDMLLASLLAGLPALAAEASPLNPAQTIIRPPAEQD